MSASLAGGGSHVLSQRISFALMRSSLTHLRASGHGNSTSHVENHLTHLVTLGYYRWPDEHHACQLTRTSPSPRGRGAGRLVAIRTALHAPSLLLVPAGRASGTRCRGSGARSVRRAFAQTARIYV